MSLFSQVFHFASLPWGRSPGHCSVCGWLLGVGHSLCDRCQRDLDAHFSERLEFAHPLDPQIRCRALWDWRPGESDPLSATLIGLKGGGRQKTWHELSRAFLRTHAAEIWALQTTGAIGFVPVPNPVPRRHHALDFARSLAEGLGAPMDLEWTFDIGKGMAPQKRKSRGQRLQSLGNRPPRTSEPEPPGPHVGGPSIWIVVDDILTTGATSLLTLRELRQAQRNPKNTYEIWTLAHRSRLAP